jgi:hypothetical protein
MSNHLHPSHTGQDSTAECVCHARAEAYLTEIIGEQPTDLTWDITHRLQGHLHVGRRELIVIAPRDAAHQPVVLAAPCWDAIRLSPADERRELLAAEAITDHARLVAVLAADEITPSLALVAA